MEPDDDPDMTLMYTTPDYGSVVAQVWQVGHEQQPQDFVTTLCDTFRGASLARGAIASESLGNAGLALSDAARWIAIERIGIAKR